MATRFSDDNQDVLTEVGLGTLAGFSVSGWVVLRADRNTFQTFWNLDAGDSDVVCCQTAVNGTSFEIAHEGGPFLTGPSPGLNNWVWFGYTHNSAGNATLLWRLATASTFSSATAAVPNATVGNTFRLGDSVWNGEWLDGSVAAVKLWSAALPQAELENESWTWMPDRLANLEAWYPLHTPEFVDYSGNGRTLTPGASAWAADLTNPPIHWRTRGLKRWTRLETGEAVVEGSAALSMSGTLEAAGTRVVRGAVTLSTSGTLTPAGVQTVKVAAILLSTATLEVVGKRLLLGQATLAASTAQDTAGHGIAHGSAGLSTVGTLEAGGTRLVWASQVLATITALEASGTRAVPGSAQLESTTELEAVASQSVSARAVLSTETAFTASGARAVRAGMTLSTSGTLDAAPSLLVPVSSALTAQTGLDLGAAVLVRAYAGLVSGTTLEPAVRLTTRADAGLSARTVLALSLGAAIIEGQTGLIASAGLSAAGLRVVSGRATLEAVAVLQTSGRLLVPGRFVLAVATSLAAAGLTIVPAGTAVLVAQAGMEAEGYVQSLTGTSLAGQAGLGSSAFLLIRASSELTTAMVVTVVSAATVPGRAALTAGPSMGISGSAVVGTVVGLSVSGVLGAVAQVFVGRVGLESGGGLAVAAKLIVRSPATGFRTQARLITIGAAFTPIIYATGTVRGADHAKGTAGSGVSGGGSATSGTGAGRMTSGTAGTATLRGRSA